MKIVSWFTQWFPRGARYTYLLMGYFLAGMVILSVFFLLHSNYLISRLEEHNRELSKSTVNFIIDFTREVDTETDKAITRIFRKNIINNLDFPHLILDSNGNAQIWARIGDNGRVQFLIREFSDNGKSYWIWQDERVDEYDEAIIQKALSDMDGKHTPLYFDIQEPDGTITAASLHYGESDIIKQIRIMPLIQIIVVAGFILIGFISYRQAKMHQQRSLWVGMAKETAHQLGTPISSLMGWVEILTVSLEDDTTSPKEIIDEMQRDIKRLNIIAKRFSKIGSRPHLEPIAIKPLLTEVANYHRKRLPHLSRQVEIREEYDNNLLLVKGNIDLLEWTLENLLKNALNAMNKPYGIITIKAFTHKNGKKVEIQIMDNGCGIPKEEQNLVFEPGFSTKRRGWGLGLTFSKRIIEDYHYARIRLLKSEVGVGTTFALILPVS